MEDIKTESDKITFTFEKDYVSDLYPGKLKYRGLLAKTAHREIRLDKWGSIQW